MTRWARATVVAGLTLLAQACGKYEHNQRGDGAGAESNDGGSASSVTTTGGAAHSAGASAQTAGQQGEAGSKDTLEAGAASACITYVLAVCERQKVCGARSSGDRCLESAADQCPDLVFSPGTARSVDELLACAKTCETVPCGDVMDNVLPACVTPGTRAQGEPCTFASQCGSLHCELHGDCGQCAEEVAIGESCAAPDVDCGPHSSCGASQTCIGMSGPLYFDGDHCTLDWPCVFEDYCDGVCKPRRERQAPCADSSQCVDGTYCGPQNLCLALPVEGQPCGFSNEGEASAFYCEHGLACDVDPSATPMSGTCRTLPGLREPCLFTADLPGNRACANEMHCDDAENPPLCILVGNAGYSCHAVWDCQPDLLCVCPPSEPNCKHQRCAIPRLEGERCDEPNTACHPAFRCEAGVCRQRGLNSVFAKACN